LACKERGFADEVKWIFARQFFPDISMQDAIKWVDAYKLGHAVIAVPDESREEKFLSYQHINFRDAVKQFATDGARKIIDNDIWINQLIPFNYPWEESFDYANICVITDERFENEVKRVHRLGGINIKIRRSFAEDAIIEDAKRRGKEVHLSDMLMPDHWFDYIIWNDNSLGELKQKVFDVMDSCIPQTKTSSSGAN
jgi:hypothetical protein